VFEKKQKRVTDKVRHHDTHHNDTQYNGTQHFKNVTLVRLLSWVSQSKPGVADHKAKCRNPECQCVDCRGAKSAIS
jgi:hypothetical protein